MRIFVSWSGDLSQVVARVFCDWIPYVLPDVEPYISTSDIEKGARWETELAKQLDETDYGVVCLTRSNVYSPWLNFESGALAKRLGHSRLVPFLFGMGRADIPSSSPLSHFQSVVFDEADILQLVRDMNRELTTPTSEQRLTVIFAKWWPDFQQRLIEISNDPKLQATDQLPLPSERELIAEVLELSRAHRRDISSIIEELKWSGAISRSLLGSSSLSSIRNSSPNSLAATARAQLSALQGTANTANTEALDFISRLLDGLEAFKTKHEQMPSWQELATEIGLSSEELQKQFFFFRAASSLHKTTVEQDLPE